jgi:adenosylhomocysteine nucleosidase
MEAYAIAKVCHFEKIPMVCVKYITDGSDANASADWASNLPRAASRFHDMFERVLRISPLGVYSMSEK